MANVYLVDKAAGESALALARLDSEAKVVLIQDGVYLDAREVSEAGREVYAIKRDIALRGLAQRLPDFIKPIDYHELVDLILENKVINFA
jgi:tRNA 2-thiouridine synthesizing protein B